MLSNQVLRLKIKANKTKYSLAWRLGTFLLRKWKLVATCILAWVVYKWFFKGRFTTKENYGKGDKYKFGQKKTQKNGSIFTIDKEDEIEIGLQHQKSGETPEKPRENRGFKTPYIKDINNTEESINNAITLRFFANSLGIPTQSTPPFIVAVQFLQRNIQKGKTQERALDIFLNVKGNLLLEGEKSELSDNDMDTLEHHMLVMDMQARIREKQLQRLKETQKKKESY